VVGEAVDLDREASVGPQRVDFVRGDARVDLRRRQPRPGDEGEEALLGLGASQRGRGVGS
jgi:hypothetical protein